MDSVVIAPVPIANSTNNQTAVAATPITLTFLPTHSQTNQCMVARVNLGGNNNIDGGNFVDFPLDGQVKSFDEDFSNSIESI